LAALLGLLALVTPVMSQPAGEPPPVGIPLDEVAPEAPPAEAPRTSVPATEPAPAEPPAPNLGATSTPGFDVEGERDAILLNFEQADIREVIYTFAAALGINYWLDPRVQGQVTARSFGPIYVDDLHPVFLQILRSNGYAAVQQGDLTMIVPAEEGKTRAPVDAATGKKESYVLEFVKVSHVNVEQIVNLISPFVSPGGDVIAYPRNNLVIISDLADNAERLRELVERFDSDTFENMTGKVYKIEHGLVEDVALELQTILETYHVAETGARAQLIPLVRLNSLAVIGFDPSIFVAIEQWLSILDVPGASGTQRQVFVYRVENSKAADLADILSEVYSDLGEQGGEPQRGRSSPLAERGLGLGGGLDQAGRRRAPAADQARARVAEQAAQLLAGQAGEGLAGVLFEQEVRIVADEVTNSLVILATPRDYQAIVAVLRALDIVPRQVLVEMMIAEITLSDDESFGITHTFGAASNNDGNNDGDNTDDGDDAGDDNAIQSLSSLLFGTSADAFRVDGTVGSAGIAGLTFRIFGDYSVTLDALARASKVKVLSRPHILTADNQEARILVGQEVPIITSQADTDVIGNNQTRFLQNVQYRDTGVVISVTPQVNSEGLVNMLVSQEVSEIAGADASVQGIVSPTFTTREAETTVVVQSGETVVIGGIISETKSDSRGGVPYLMNVPVLGQLFRSNSDSKRRTELIVLITPYVVRDRNEARSVTAEFKERVDDVLQELNIEEVDTSSGHTVILQKPVM
jgi:general secretion pathway protein D